MEVSQTTLDGLRDEIRGPELFVCSAGFENRCLAVPEAVVGTVKKCIMFYNEHDVTESTAEHLKELKGMFSGSRLFGLRNDNPIYSTDSIVRGVEEGWSEDLRRIVVDITTFSRESLLILMKYLWSKIGAEHEVTLLYNRAIEYAVGLEAPEKWLSGGIKEVRSILGYSGTLLPSRQNHLIIMAGFESIRAQRLVSECEPSLVSLGVADPSEVHTAEHQEVNEDHRQRIANVSETMRYFEFSAYNPELTYDAIVKQIEGAADLNTIIAPMNTKLSAIGAGLVGHRRDDVQLCYAQADYYNYRNYSRGGPEVYVVRIRKADLRDHGS